ncbi:cob(I)yrinic acid a,c-diamide adenosyltransferase [Polycladidibacter stylochi]|uniref:cob(I)yrinic acid a,c-diamide adenosyltransferase n=1 Tax=Polycladidibacter stylochi TaxID=1807766 RepID=UPI00082E3D4D|nr:cob(I)yrinic acid a,c-diamide adenosyltransferase [Pseudovibrio stylochi]
MVILNKIYTRTGDSGTTALSNGERRVKHDLRIEAYGTVDEANAILGIVRSFCEPRHRAIDAIIFHIQNDLFDVGADLATPTSEEEEEGSALRVQATQVSWLENQIDSLNSDLKPLRSFVLPGGCKVAAQLHHGRTVVRRAERLAYALAEIEAVNPAAPKYLNRLSDLLFVASRYVNELGQGDVLWVPGKHRLGAGD